MSNRGVRCKFGKLIDIGSMPAKPDRDPKPKFPPERPPIPQPPGDGFPIDQDVSIPPPRSDKAEGNFKEEEEP